MEQNCGDTGRKREPGMERPVQAREASGRQIRQASQERDADRTEVGKHVDSLSRKAAIVFMLPVPQTDTGR